CHYLFVPRSPPSIAVANPLSISISPPPRSPLPLVYHISIYAPSDYRRPSSLTSPSPSFRPPPPWVVRLVPCYQLKRRGTQI
ncbi:Os01g0174400, partial [Oryza sativa Japonica Group]